MILKGDVLSELSVDDLLELDVDLIDEVTDFMAMPSGHFRFNVTAVALEDVGGEGKKAIKVEFSLPSLVELADPNDEEAVELVAASFADGATVDHSEYFFLDGGKKKSAFGIRSFSTIFKPLVPEGTKAKVSELMELAMGSSGEAYIEKTSYIPEGKTEAERKYNSRIKPTMVIFD